MELTTENKKQLEKLLLRPRLVGAEHRGFLQDMLASYPYFQPLHLLLAKALKDTAEQEQAFAKASLYNSGQLLHQVIFEPQTLRAEGEVSLTSYESISSNSRIAVVSEAATADVIDDPTLPLSADSVQGDEKFSTIELPDEEEATPFAEPVFSPYIDTDLVENKEIEELEAETAESNSSETPAQQVDRQEDMYAPSEVIASSLVVDIDENPDTVDWGDSFVTDSFHDAISAAEVMQFTHPEPETIIESPSVDETVENNWIDTPKPLFEAPEIENLPPLMGELEKVFGDEYQTENAKVAYVFTPEIESVVSEVIPNQDGSSIAEPVNNAAEQPVPPSNEERFFELEGFFTEYSGIEPTPILSAETVVESAPIANITAYDDDKLPFSFLWWLAKTRQENQPIIQPFTEQKSPLQTSVSVDENLHQQYAEHIFHLEGAAEKITESLADNLAQKPTSLHTNEKDIVDNFIKNDPQMGAPKPNQINNENIAKRSAEDHSDLVSETLAEIYIEQTLYHKAIDTYRKLSLKFPEKSRYFADLIKSLEKKI